MAYNGVLIYSTSRAGLFEMNLLRIPNLKTCLVAFTRPLAASGVAILRSRLVAFQFATAPSTCRAFRYLR